MDAHSLTIYGFASPVTLRVLTAQDAGGVAAKLVSTLTDRDGVACAYDAEATASAVTGVLLQAGLAGEIP